MTFLVNKEKAKRSFYKGMVFCCRLLVSFLLLVWIIHSIDLNVFKNTIVSPRLYPIIVMAVVGVLFIILSAIKLWILLRAFSSISLGLFLKYFFFTCSIASLVPAIVGDITLIGLAKRSDIPMNESISALLMDRLITTTVALFIFTPFTLVFALHIEPLFMIFLTITSLVLFVALIWLVFRFAPRIMDKLFVLSGFWHSFSMYATRYRVNLYKNFLITCLRGIVSGITIISALMAANLQPPVGITICISNTLSILSYIPISVSGLGVFEGSGLILFEAVGLNREQVLAGLVYHRIYIIIWACLTWLVLTSMFAIKRYSGNHDFYK